MMREYTPFKDPIPGMFITATSILLIYIELLDLSEVPATKQKLKDPGMYNQDAFIKW